LSVTLSFITIWSGENSSRQALGIDPSTAGVFLHPNLLGRRSN
jgi:hypothetical protein